MDFGASYLLTRTISLIVLAAAIRVPLAPLSTAIATLFPIQGVRGKFLPMVIGAASALAFCRIASELGGMIERRVKLLFTVDTSFVSHGVWKQARNCCL